MLRDNMVLEELTEAVGEQLAADVEQMAGAQGIGIIFVGKKCMYQEIAEAIK